MAVDTVDKRRNISGIPHPPLVVDPTNDAGKGKAWRQQVGGGYGAIPVYTLHNAVSIKAGNATVTAVGGLVVKGTVSLVGNATTTSQLKESVAETLFVFGLPHGPSIQETETVVLFTFGLPSRPVVFGKMPSQLAGAVVSNGQAVVTSAGTVTVIPAALSAQAGLVVTAGGTIVKNGVAVLVGQAAITPSPDGARLAKAVLSGTVLATPSAKLTIGSAKAGSTSAVEVTAVVTILSDTGVWVEADALVDGWTEDTADELVWTLVED